MEESSLYDDIKLRRAGKLLLQIVSSLHFTLLTIVISDLL